MLGKLFVFILLAMPIQRAEYPLTTVVTEVSETEVSAMDFNGNIWNFPNEAEDWMVGDVCAMIMDNNGTSDIYDDTIVSTRYSGWLDGKWGYPETIVMEN